MPQSQTQAGGFFQLAPLCLLIFIDAMGFAMVAPILAAHPLSASPVIQSLIYGVAVGIYPLATFFAAPILGAISDRSGRLPVMIFCGIGLAASYAVIAVGMQIESATLVILGRAVGGLTAATQAIALAALADAGDISGKDSRINFGLLASSLGFVLGPVLTGVLTGLRIMPQLKESAPLAVVVVLTTVTLVWLGSSFRHPERISAAESNPLDFSRSFRELAHTFRSPVLKRLARIFLLQQLGWGAFFFFIPPFLVTVLAFDAARVSYYMATIGIGFCVSFAFVMPLLRRRFSARAIGVGSMLITAVGIALSVVAQVPVIEWIIAIPVAAATATGYGALIMMFTDEAHGNEGEILGVTASINALAFGVTSLAGGVMAGGAMAAPLILAAILMFAATLLLTTNPTTQTAVTT